MAFDFNRLFPEAAKKKQEDKLDNILYIILVEWGWDYKTFQETPIPIIIRVLNKWNEIKKKEAKKSGK